MFKDIAVYITYEILKLEKGTHLANAVEFFIYDTQKIFFLLTTVIFVVSIIRSYFPPERTRQMLSHKKLFIGNVFAALLGVVTPFCSCSAVPLFIGFIEAGVPLGVTFSFLIASPMVNEIAVVLLWGMLGWKVTLLYIATGLVVAITAGIIIGKMRLEKWVEDYVYDMKTVQCVNPQILTFKERIDYAKSYVLEILKKVWLYIIIAIGIGGFIHGYVPQDFVTRYAGPDNPFSVPVAVLLGVPLYASCVGIIPVASALISKGLAVGTVLAFMMAVTALSLPELIILRKVIKLPLLAVFVIIMTVAIIMVGYMFNAIL
ncbi:MAG: permease [Thermodesulfovibrionales bacterium]|nr:permease [Thermodesulfovibrionales bacterium]